MSRGDGRQQRTQGLVMQSSSVAFVLKFSDQSRALPGNGGGACLPAWTRPIVQSLQARHFRSVKLIEHAAGDKLARRLVQSNIVKP